MMVLPITATTVSSNGSSFNWKGALCIAPQEYRDHLGYCRRGYHRQSQHGSSCSNSSSSNSNNSSSGGRSRTCPIIFDKTLILPWFRTVVAHDVTVHLHTPGRCTETDGLKFDVPWKPFSVFFSRSPCLRPSNLNHFCLCCKSYSTLIQVVLYPQMWVRFSRPSP